MKLIVVHGDDTTKSYERLNKFIDVAKKRGWEVVKIGDGDGLNFREKLTGELLFKKERLFIVEDASLLNKGDAKWLKDNIKNLQGTLVLYRRSLIPKTLLSYLPKPDKVETFDLPKTIFKFLDSFYPGNASSSLRLMHEVLEKEGSGFLVALLARHLRDMYITKEDPDLLGYPGWRISKLKNQAEKFTEDKLIQTVSELSLMDYEVKTGQANVVSSLDLIISTKLE